MSAFHAESIRPDTPKWLFYGTDYPNVRLNILRGCIEASPEGTVNIELPESGDSIFWEGVRVYAHNVVLGKLWFEYTGRLEMVNRKSKMKAIFDFKPYSWFSGQMNRVEGYRIKLINKKKTIVKICKNYIYFVKVLMYELKVNFREKKIQ